MKDEIVTDSLIKLQKISKALQPNKSEKVTNEHDKENLKIDVYLQSRDRKSLMI